ncbi:MAG: hypothetical protein MJ138_04525 [Kiritimatiellae bacterium]|nr:hypothetical protein [Kiritimatiellia bacterium]
MELLEIEKELAGPEKAAALEKHDAVLVALQGRLKDALRTGLPPGEFAKCEGLDEAIVVARKLLRLQIKE